MGVKDLVGANGENEIMQMRSAAVNKDEKVDFCCATGNLKQPTLTFTPLTTQNNFNYFKYGPEINIMPLEKSVIILPALVWLLQLNTTKSVYTKL